MREHRQTQVDLHRKLRKGQFWGSRQVNNPEKKGRAAVKLNWFLQV